MTSSTSSSESESPHVSHSPSKKRKLEETSESDNGTDAETGSEASASTEQKPKRSKLLEAKSEDGIETEVKVLSHKEQRRLKKKLAKEGSSQGAEKVEGDPKETKQGKRGNKSKETNDGESKLKRQNSIWVGNLSFKTTSDALRSFFKEAGEVTRVHMPMQASGGPGGANQGQKNKGFAYVDFANPDAKTIAITFSEKNLDGRRLLIKDGDDFNGRPKAKTEDLDGAKSGLSKMAQKILASQKQPPIPCLFIGNLGFEATEESIRGMIEGHTKALADRSSSKPKRRDDEEKNDMSERSKEGQTVSTGIKKIRMGTFEDSGLCKGFAFIDFESTVHSTNVLTNPRNHYLDGRKLVVEYASADAARRGGYREKSQTSASTASTGKGTTRTERTTPRKDKQLPRESAETQESQETQMNEDYDKWPKKMRRTEEPSKSKFNRRPKPGAALALAKREKFAIVPSEGSRMTFT